jgi:dipeptidase E
MENVTFHAAEGEISKTFYTGKGAGLTGFAIIPHYNNPAFQDACGLNAEKWAAKIPADVYAIDEQTAIEVVAGQVEVVSEGQWKFFSKLA